MNTTYQQCKQCIMDTSAGCIEFDKNGICNFCKIHLERTSKEQYSQKELDNLTNKIKKSKKKNSKYDCIIGVSGGVDSTYVAYLVKEKLKLNPLAIHLDNGWNDELAVSNIEKCLNKLDIDLYTHVIDWSEFKDLQLAFMKASIPNIEILTDHAITAILYKIARKYNVNYIINGANISSESIMPKSWMWYGFDLKLIKSIHKKHGNIPIKTFPTLSLKSYAKYVFFNKVKSIPILNYINYDKEKTKKFLSEKLQWKDYGGKHFESIFTRFFQAYILPKKFNIDKRLPHLSSLILSNQITKKEALEILKKPIYPNEKMLNEDITYFKKKMGFTDHTFELMMNQKPNYYTDFKNNASFITNPKYKNIYYYIRTKILGNK